MALSIIFSVLSKSKNIKKKKKISYRFYLFILQQNPFEKSVFFMRTYSFVFFISRPRITGRVTRVRGIFQIIFYQANRQHLFSFFSLFKAELEDLLMLNILIFNIYVCFLYVNTPDFFSIFVLKSSIGFRWFNRGEYFLIFFRARQLKVRVLMLFFAENIIIEALIFEFFLYRLLKLCHSC